MGQQIQISDELWKYLNSNRNPGETFNEVILRISKIEITQKDGNQNI